MPRQKPRSRRQTLHKKHSIEKKIGQHKQKMRRLAKKHPEIRKKLKKAGMSFFKPWTLKCFDLKFIAGSKILVKNKCWGTPSENGLTKCFFTRCTRLDNVSLEGATFI